MRIKEFQRIHLEEVKLLNEIESKRQKFLSQRREEKLEDTLDRIGLPVKCTSYRSQNYEPRIQFHFWRVHFVNYFRIAVRNRFSSHAENTSVDGALSNIEKWRNGEKWSNRILDSFDWCSARRRSSLRPPSSESHKQSLSSLILSLFNSIREADRALRSREKAAHHRLRRSSYSSSTKTPERAVSKLYRRPWSPQGFPKCNELKLFAFESLL